METQIVLLSGKQGSGKTSLQRNLVQTWNRSAEGGFRAYALNFASVLYRMHDAVLAILKDNGIDRTGRKDGQLLQVLGTEYGRKVLGDNVWINCVKAEMSALYKEAKEVNTKHLLFVVGDCRFENEFFAFPDDTRFSTGGETLKVRLRCLESIRRDRIGATFRPNTEHSSETSLDALCQENKFDVYLETDLVSVEHCTSLLVDQLFGSPGFTVLPSEEFRQKSIVS